MALGARDIAGMDEQRAVLRRELSGRTDQDGAALVGRARLLVAIGSRHVELVAGADAAGQGHDGVRGEHIDVVARRRIAPVRRP